MSSISSIDTSIYSGIIEDISSYIPTRNALEAKTPIVEDKEYSYVDLSKYYSNIRAEDLLAQAGDNVERSAQDLDNAMASAIQNGYGVKEACNIRTAQVAYAANCAVFQSACKISTFELEV